ncbi:MAG: hypothetical protein UY31_C0019G0002 [Candidatus Wolfebacteria bacterium GW2011_GWE1_48_7]|uniref:Uncharacterized protein n=2 Tax=Candidatus Wolfeibacteriota TaxID=1752735 RepID=A0A0G1WHR3_9BACT|nr:MAG: hypothetical protein UX70_C0001G0962 [Candidatus Wolfebacteria bacterium GW2011_GWB1_47_1]KKU35062.1 MAG: hypothetical protein UX49_C0030G0025 [Candidatus Wolfebacteria bacterium GW2011_GWC2_46_275]KKU41258.1 MAG: hypothetical protein UX58_C0009G0001 [Candidatus Wolfebacteria bacterium GW2011_GWB2_46_69]KKU53621.1 MAG: hypothetical protein UX76_C0012G0001 [Candidatus Wolfebacteria bacterium GW2011_GWC1_47_103]KKU59412.1 MAG: hypothetical protein UX83_C0005G0031 [Candidatus Wolfebacteria
MRKEDRMAHYSKKERWREVCLVVALLASIAVGIVAGFVWEKITQKEDEPMKDRTGWVFATMIIAIIAVQRMVDQVMGINVSTSYVIPIIPEFAIDTSQYVRALYVPIEMGMALLAICVVEFQMQRLPKGSIFVFACWITSMVAVMNALGVLGWHPLGIFTVIGVISLVTGLREYGEAFAAAWVGLERGIIVGCLLGGSFRYGFTFGCFAVIAAWIVQDRCLWIGTLLGALVKKAKNIGASAEH